MTIAELHFHFLDSNGVCTDTRSLEENQIYFSVTCSKGTYIRVLGLEIAKKLGTVGHLTQLTRTAVGEYRIHDSVKLKEFGEKWISTEH